MIVLRKTSICFAIAILHIFVFCLNSKAVYVSGSQDTVTRDLNLRQDLNVAGTTDLQGALTLAELQSSPAGAADTGTLWFESDQLFFRNATGAITALGGSDNDWTTVATNNIVSGVSGNVGIGTGTVSAAENKFEVQLNDTSVSPMARFDQDGTGDSSIVFSTDSQTVSMGIDASDGDSFLIGEGINGVSGNGRIKIESTGNLRFSPATTTTFSGGSITSTSAVMTMGNGIQSAPTYSFIGSTSTGMFRPIANEIAFSNNNSETMRLGSSGNVGIGDATPTEAKLIVNADGTAFDDSWNGNGNGNGIAVLEQDANIDIISTPNAEFGSAINYHELDTGAGGSQFQNMWTQVRETTAFGNDMQFRYGTNNDYTANPLMFGIQTDGDIVLTGNVTSSGNNDIDIIPGGTGTLSLDGIGWPAGPGANGQALLFNASGDLVAGPAGSSEWSLGGGILSPNSSGVTNVAIGGIDATADIYLTAGGSATFNNNQSSTAGFTVKSQGDDSLIVTDPANNRVGIGEGSPTAKLEVNADGTNYDTTWNGNPNGNGIAILETDANLDLISDSRVGLASAINFIDLNPTLAAGTQFQEMWSIIKDSASQTSNLQFRYGADDDYTANATRFTLEPDGDALFTGFIDVPLSTAGTTDNYIGTDTLTNVAFVSTGHASMSAIGNVQINIDSNDNTPGAAPLATFTVSNNAAGYSAAAPVLFQVVEDGDVTVASTLTTDGLNATGAVDLTGTFQYDHASAAANFVLTSSDAAGNATWVDPNTLVSGLDHGSLGGLTDDDHTQYALLAGRSGGQTLIGGSATGNILTLQGNSAGDGTGSVHISDTDALSIGPAAAGAGNTGELRFSELTANGTDFASIKAPDALTTVYTLTLPPDDGDADEVLTTNGSGVLTWEPAGDGDWTIVGNDINSTVSGNVGIGVAAASTTAKLHVDGTLRFDTGNASIGDVLVASSVNGDADWAALSSVDHGSLGGLTDDDHTQYALLAGRGTNQTLIGGAATNNTLTLQSNAAADGTGSINITNTEALALGPADGSNTAELRLFELAGNGANYLSIKAPDALPAANVELTLPADDGDNNDVLITDGSGVLSWGPAPAPANAFTNGGNSFTPAGPAVLGTTNAKNVNLIADSNLVATFDTTGGQVNTGNIAAASMTVSHAATPTQGFSFTTDTNTKIYNVGVSGNRPRIQAGGSDAIRITGSDSNDNIAIDFVAAVPNPVGGGDTAIGTLTANFQAGSTVNMNGNVNIGNDTGDNVGFVGRVTTGLVPDTVGNLNLGSDAQRWGDVYANDTLFLGLNGDGGAIEYETTDNIIGINPDADIATAEVGAEFQFGGDGVMEINSAATPGTTVLRAIGIDRFRAGSSGQGFDGIGTGMVFRLPADLLAPTPRNAFAIDARLADATSGLLSSYAQFSAKVTTPDDDTMTEIARLGYDNTIFNTVRGFSFYQLNATDTFETRYYELGNVNYVGLQAPDTLAANVSLILPPDDGDPDQVLTTDGSGVLTWGDVATGSDTDWNVVGVNMELDSSVTGNVGIGTAAGSTQAKLDVAGPIKISSDATSCGSSQEGMVKYDSTNGELAVCNGFAWVSAATGRELDDVDEVAATIFITSSTYTGDLDGRAGADSICQTHATAAGLPGYYIALLATTGTAIADIIPRNVKLKNTNGDILNRADWRSSGLDSSVAGGVRRDENGNINGNDVWTGTNSAGELTGTAALNRCDDWQNGTFAIGVFEGNVGDDQSNSSWLNNSTAVCSGLRALYCVDATKI